MLFLQIWTALQNSYSWITVFSKLQVLVSEKQMLSVSFRSENRSLDCVCSPASLKVWFSKWKWAIRDIYSCFTDDWWLSLIYLIMSVRAEPPALPTKVGTEHDSVKRFSEQTYLKSDSFGFNRITGKEVARIGDNPSVDFLCWMWKLPLNGDTKPKDESCCTWE